MKNFRFNGINKKNNYFEGWYIKVVDSSNDIVYGFIFGITFYKQDPHSFIQIIDSTKLIPTYHRFDISDFYYNDDSIRIKDNVLSINYLKISIDNFKFEVNFEDKTPLKTHLLMPGTMGMFRYLPLPTYHEVLFLNINGKGIIKENEKERQFDANCYMEKNWGNRFPNTWIWAQASNFTNSNCYLILAVAEIFKNFKGFFCILNINNKEYRFATYNGFKVKIVKCDSKNIEIDFIKNKRRLNIKIDYEKDYPVIAPLKNGKMKKVINESLKSILTFTLYDDDKILFSDVSSNVGCENLFLYS